MIIISQYEDKIFNFNNLINIKLNFNKSIKINTIRGEYTVGEYNSQKRAKEVFDDIVKAIYTECRIYNMPKE